MLITSQHYNDSYLQTCVLNTHTHTHSHTHPHKLNKQYLPGRRSFLWWKLVFLLFGFPVVWVCLLFTYFTLQLHIARCRSCFNEACKPMSSLPAPLFPSAFRTYLKKVVLMLLYLCLHLDSSEIFRLIHKRHIILICLLGKRFEMAITRVFERRHVYLW